MPALLARTALIVIVRMAGLYVAGYVLARLVERFDRG